MAVPSGQVTYCRRMSACLAEAGELWPGVSTWISMVEPPLHPPPNPSTGWLMAKMDPAARPMIVDFVVRVTCIVKLPSGVRNNEHSNYICRIQEQALRCVISVEMGCSTHLRGSSATPPLSV